MREHELYGESFRMARGLADWKRKVPMRFSSLRLLDVSIEGIRGDTILVERPFDVTVRIDPGKLEPSEVLVELVIGKKDGSGFTEPPECVTLRPDGKDADGVLTFFASYTVRPGASLPPRPRRQAGDGAGVLGVGVWRYNRIFLSSPREIGRWSGIP
jgi:hypothetical protein